MNEKDIEKNSDDITKSYTLDRNYIQHTHTERERERE